MKSDQDLAWQALLDTAKDLSGNNPAAKNLWLIDENWQVKYKPPAGSLCLSNRFDIATSLQQAGIDCRFNDFDGTGIEVVDQCFIRISKEKLNNHHMLNLARQLITQKGQIQLAGYEKEGFKSLLKRAEQHGFIVINKTRLKKGAFIASLACNENTLALDDNQYPELRKIEQPGLEFYSKPGLFGWEKIDEGSALLIDTLKQHYKKTPANILDLGCGYGYLSIMAKKHFANAALCATDNNAAALLACEKNLAKWQNCEVVASNAGSEINQRYELILCNPPFHQGFQTEKSLTEQFLANASELLTKNGEAWFVVNVFIGIEKLLPQYFASFDVLENNSRFKVLRMRN